MRANTIFSIKSVSPHFGLGWKKVYYQACDYYNLHRMDWLEKDLDHATDYLKWNMCQYVNHK